MLRTPAPGLSCFMQLSLLSVLAAAAAAGQVPSPGPASETRVEEQRAHQTYQGALTKNPAQPPADWVGRHTPESTFIVRRWKNRTGTERMQFHYMVDFGNGVRLRQTTDTDYFTCRGTDLIEVIWSVDNREYVRSSEAMEKCPDHTEESYTKWAKGVAAGKKRGPASYLRSIETKQIKVAMDWDEWLAHGNNDIRQTLSDEFAQVLKDEIGPLSRVDILAGGVCQEFAGLYQLGCGRGTEAASLLKVGKPDCDFDATFGEPCTAEQQRAYDARKERGTLSPTPAPQVK